MGVEMPDIIQAGKNSTKKFNRLKKAECGLAGEYRIPGSLRYKGSFASTCSLFSLNLIGYTLKWLVGGGEARRRAGQKSYPWRFKPGRDGVRVGEENNSYSRKDTFPLSSLRYEISKLLGNWKHTLSLSGHSWKHTAIEGEKQKCKKPTTTWVGQETVLGPDH